ncbi:MAG: ABC transporter substrate-binding protein [Lachnospiraceae bacterium]|nr:ABC transporter substrate-binding protein [Lachnospiraceae bacterium]
MKRKAALFMALAVTASLFTGCGGNAKGTQQAASDSSEKTTSSSGVTASSTEGSGSGEAPYVCKIVCVGDASSEACQEVAEKASEITMEKFNTKIDLVRLGYGSFVNEVNLMLSSGEKLDLIPSFGISAMTAANTGQILELTDLIKEYGQGIDEVVTDSEWACVTFGDGIYAVPNNKEKAQGFGVVMRKDMLDAVDYDLDTIKTEADLEPLFEKIKEAYPDTYPIVSDNGQMGYHMIERDDIGGDYGVIMHSTETDKTEVVNYFATEEYKDMAQRHYEWAQKGLIMPDATNNTQNAYDLIAAGKGFAYYTNTKPGIEAEWGRKVGKEMQVLELVSPFRTTSGVANQWFIAHQSEQPDKAMQVLNEIYTNPELSDLLINGIEGEHYVKDAAKGILTYPDGVDASNTTYSSVAWVWPNELISTPWETDGAAIWSDTDAFNKSAKESIALGFAWDNSNVLNEVTACNNVKAKYENALNCGTLDPEVTIPKMLSELKDAGVEEVIAEKQKQVDAWMQTK